ncbi:MAG: response regulator [Bacteroidales bacterium]
MELIQQLVNYGISKEKGDRQTEWIRNRNIFNLITALFLIISGITGLVFGITYLAIINLSSFILFAITFVIYPPFRAEKTGGFAGLSIIGVTLILNYYLAVEASHVIMIFIMLYPIASVTIASSRGIWFSVALLTMMVAGNIFPVNGMIAPLDTLNLLMYVFTYLLILIATMVIQKNQEQNIKIQTEKVHFYEQEITQRDEFIAKLSHKLRTSLSNITLINNLVHDSRMSTAQKELLDTLKTSTLDLSNDVNELVEIATPAIVDFKQSILSFSFMEALGGIADILRSDKRHPINFEIVVSQEPEYYIIGDPSLLRTIMLNLVKGITDFGLKEQDIKLIVLLDYETQSMYGLKFVLEFDVENKAGIERAILNLKRDPNAQQTLFSVANRLLSLTGGKPIIQTQDDKHLLFFYQDYSKDLTRKSEKASTEGESEGEKKKKALIDSSILLVEDNAVNQKIVILSLNRLVKNIDVANNGKEALDMFGTKKYDAILMDIQMPVMDGITATKKMREIESTTDNRIPIIAITANALSGDRDHCLAAGADDYLSKPFQVEDLVGRITSLLERS